MNGYGSAEFLAADMQQKTYAEVCRQLNWVVRPWNPVAKELTLLTTGRKKYRWILRDGIRHRLRVYTVPTPDSASVDAVARRGSDNNVSLLKAHRRSAEKSRPFVDVARPASARRRAYGRNI